MRIKPEQLGSHLQRNLARVYLVGGDEPLLVDEATDAIRAAARKSGCDERVVHTLETGFDWNVLREAQSSLSLFAARRLLELRMNEPKPGDAGAKALCEYCARPPQDDVLLVITGKFAKETTSAKWFQAVDQAGVVVQAWPVEAAQLPAWIERRLLARGLKPSADATALLAARVQGNLLAAAQEIEKLALLCEPGPLDVEAVAEAVADSARFDVFDLADAALGGDAAACARTLRALRAEGVEPPLVIWALTREIRTLAQVAGDVQRGLAADHALQARRVWDKRKPLMKAALRRLSAGRCRALLLQAGEVDLMAKGQRSGNVWDELLQLSLGFAGAAVLNPPRAST